jgi:hypothetical protein
MDSDHTCPPEIGADRSFESGPLSREIVERRRQMGLWCNAADDLNTRNDWVAYICRYVAGGDDNSNSRFAVEKFRANLIKAATLCVAAVEAIDRNGGLP